MWSLWSLGVTHQERHWFFIINYLPVDCCKKIAVSSWYRFFFPEQKLKTDLYIFLQVKAIIVIDCEYRSINSNLLPCRLRAFSSGFLKHFITACFNFFKNKMLKLYSSILMVKMYSLWVNYIMNIHFHKLISKLVEICSSI